MGGYRETPCILEQNVSNAVIKICFTIFSKLLNRDKKCKACYMCSCKIHNTF